MKSLSAVTSVAIATATTFSVWADEPDEKDKQWAKEVYAQALAELARKDYAAACPHLEAVVRLAPNALGGVITLAECYEESGRLTIALTVYRRAEKVAAEQKDDARRAKAALRIVAIEAELPGLAATNPLPTTTGEPPPVTEADQEKKPSRKIAPVLDDTTPPPPVAPVPQYVAVPTWYPGAPPPPDMRPWYGWQTMIGVIAGDITALVGAVEDSDAAVYIGMSARTITSPIVHFGQGNTGRGIGSFFLYGVPGVALMATQDPAFLESDTRAFIRVLGVPVYLIAPIVDWAAMSRGKAPESAPAKGASALLPSNMSLVPRFEPQWRGLMLVGQF